MRRLTVRAPSAVSAHPSIMPSMGPRRRTSSRLVEIGQALARRPDGPLSMDVVQRIADDVRCAFGWEAKAASQLFEPAQLESLTQKTISIGVTGVVTAAIRDQLEAWVSGPLESPDRAAHRDRARRQASVAADLVYQGYAFERGWEFPISRPGHMTWVDLYDEHGREAGERGPEVAGR
jgi:hypothetical protein